MTHMRVRETEKWTDSIRQLLAVHCGWTDRSEAGEDRTRVNVGVPVPRLVFTSSHHATYNVNNLTDRCGSMYHQ